MTRSIRITCAGTVALTLAFSGSVSAETFTDDFSAGLRPAWWSVIQSTTNFYSVDASQGNVQLAKTSAHNPGGFQYVFVRVNLADFGGVVTGDFSTQIDFSKAVVPGPGLDQVELHTYYQDGSIFYTVYDNSGGLNAHVWDGGSVLGRRSFSGDSGTFLIRRTGSTVTGYFNGSPLYSTTRASALTAIDFVLQNNAGSDDAISVTFDNFSVTAALAPPRLSIAAVAGTQVQLAWTTNAASYVMEQSASAAPPDWTVVTNSPAVADDHFVLLLDASDSQRFFRLRKP
jgi:hypothetical protein